MTQCGENMQLLDNTCVCNDNMLFVPDMNKCTTSCTLEGLIEYKNQCIYSKSAQQITGISIFLCLVLLVVLIFVVQKRRQKLKITGKTGIETNERISFENATPSDTIKHFVTGELNINFL
ncbi:Hypothetical_protein [Hexamita inflata]|uniref:Hypothetical_protein n=1 Tax=Hexamita inflata TaxID=28002 RepID=A0AA86NS47_9EUKA|nr:Hypothetical protein HINF_LOCUS13137 [Hexamita inflata]CAI9936492.1 Hypothetical protein HINF_LOCUS24137 [Hexamita inflata]